ncbi:coiled-coil domain-containing protein 146 [Dryobates pubescens]|uniref:coiled-coil domain-containing protein 146 n=1 Tax=Dryobates pubescens TaxID=118200 RepID=UPI0023B8A4B5|nr:coiled-coil domain-containing protein 146 [Dryobates pubescens]
MSQASGESSCSSDTELEIEEQPIYALAPTVYSQDEGSTDVTASPAFQCLDELFSAGKITGTRANELKEKYTLLHKTVISLQESEIQLLQEAKHLSVELEQQQHELEKAEQFPEDSSSEASQIRLQLLGCQNEYKAIKDREYEVQFQIECLEEEKSLLENEYERIPRQRETEKKVKRLKDNCDELFKEVVQRKAEINAIKEEISSKRKLMLADENEKEQLLEKQDALKDELVKILRVPTHLRKETEKMNRKERDAEKQKEALNHQIDELNATLKAIEKRTEEILQERGDVREELHEKQILLESKEKECIALTKSLEISREKESAVLLDRAALEDNLRIRALEIKKQQDLFLHKQTQKDRELRNLKKMELQLNVIYDSLKQDKSQHERLKLEVETLSKSNGVLLERRRELQKEVEVTKRRLAEQETMSNMDAQVLKECIAEEGQLFQEQEKHRHELSRLVHLTKLRVEEREKKSRDVQKARVQIQHVIKEIKRKDLEIRDYKMRKREIQKQLQGFAKMCDVIQKERNKCINLVHACQHKAREIRNQIKLLGNEMENLRSIVLTKERKLQKLHLKNKNNAAIIESLKSDCGKIVQIMHEMKEKEQQQCLELEKFTSVVTHIEEEIVQQCKQYERAIQQQTNSGLLLREREEELCILYEKVNTQELLCRNGDLEMQAMDERIRLLKLKIAEKKRQIKLWFRTLPVKNALDAQLVVLQIQYSQCKDRIKHMEDILAEPTNERRKRDLRGKDPSPPELTKKIEQLEAELLQKEKLLLEKDILYEHVSRLTDGIRTMAANRNQKALLLAKRTNEMRKKTKDQTRQVMALVAEVSMKQALATKLQQEMRDKEQFLMTVSSRIDQGLPPPKETENEWLKILRNEKMQKAAAEARAKHATEEEEAANMHTAVQRPTAYIPDDEFSLPVPRPYGALAPFKPSEPGSNMRHFRKPLVKPIEV